MYFSHTTSQNDTEDYVYEQGESKVFYLFRMVPPSDKGFTYYFSLLNPRNFRKETFIDKSVPTTYVEKDPLTEER